MIVLPFQGFTITTSARPIDAAERLASAVATMPLIEGADTSLPFQGWVEDYEFRISRISGARQNAFVADVRGRIVYVSGGSRLKGSMTLHPAVLLMLLVSTGFISNELFRGAIDPYLTRRQALQGVGVFVTMWLFYLTLFSLEAVKARALLSSVVNGTHTNKAPASPASPVLQPSREQLADLREQYEFHKRASRLGAVTLFVAFTVIFPGGGAARSSVLLLASLAIGGIFSTLVWRCPGCRNPFGRTWRVAKCPHCDLQLEADKVRQ